MALLDQAPMPQQAPGQPQQQQPGMPPVPGTPQVGGPVQPSRTEQLMANRLHQVEQQLMQLTNLVIELQNRKVVQVDMQVNRNDQDRIQGATMLGRFK